MVDGVEIPVHIIGDAAYPLKQWLIKGFNQHHQLSQEHARYTHALSSARMAVENAFEQLKGRWRCLMKRNDIDLDLMPSVVAACCILHNICELQKDNLVSDKRQSGLGQPHAVVYEGERANTTQLIHNTITGNLTAMLSE